MTQSPSWRTCVAFVLFAVVFGKVLGVLATNIHGVLQP
jgi:hypothetical protein